MKKKFILLFFASVASVYAYTIEVNNKSDRKIIATIEIPYRWKRPLTVEPGENKQFSDLSRDISEFSIRVDTKKRWKRNAVIPRNMRGKDITIDVDINESVPADPAAISIAISKTNQ
jgi:hypothetical protein